MPSSSRPTILEYLAANLRRQRTRAGYTQDELANALDMDIRYLQRIERGSVNIGLVQLSRIAEALEISPGLLLRKATLPEPQRGRPKKRQ